jgi:hypothetical protein
MTLRRIPIALAIVVALYLLFSGAYWFGRFAMADGSPAFGSLDAQIAANEYAIASNQAAIDALEHSTLLAQADTGSGSSLPPATTTGPAPKAPSVELHNPVTDPIAAFDDVKAAKKLGWPLALLALLIMLTRGLGTIGTRWGSMSWLAWLGKGSTAVIVSGVGTVATAAFNTLALGGTWFAVMMAAAGAFFALLAPAKPAGS